MRGHEAVASCETPCARSPMLIRPSARPPAVAGPRRRCPAASRDLARDTSRPPMVLCETLHSYGASRKASDGCRALREPSHEAARGVPRPRAQHPAAVSIKKNSVFFHIGNPSSRSSPCTHATLTASLTHAPTLPPPFPPLCFPNRNPSRCPLSFSSSSPLSDHQLYKI